MRLVTIIILTLSLATNADRVPDRRIPRPDSQRIESLATARSGSVAHPSTLVPRRELRAPELTAEQAAELEELEHLDAMDVRWLPQDASMAKEWKAQAAAAVAYIPWTWSYSRTIAEVRTPATPEEARNQQEELAHFRGLGYDSVLAVWQGEPSSQLAVICRDLKAQGWGVIVAYGQPESGQQPYIPWARLVSELTTLLAHADAFVPGWRGIDSHHADSGVRDTLIRQLSAAARQARSDIPLVQSLYMNWHAMAIEPAPMHEMSGYIIANAGQAGVRPEGLRRLLERAFEYPDRLPLPVLALILGDRPYYDSFKRTQWTPAGIREQCSRLEDRFHRADMGTITLSGDGADGRAHGTRQNGTADTLTKTKWRTGQ